CVCEGAFLFVFFFQAEDGIRDRNVTGVQTCALPILSMIILGAVVGLCLLVGGLRHGSMAHNRTGATNYLTMIIALTALAFAVPALIGTNGSSETWQEIPIVIATIGIYAFFLYRQMGPQAQEFTEVDPRVAPAPHISPAEEEPRAQGIVEILSVHRTEIILRLALLVTTVLPIVLLSHDMASLLDDGFGRLGAPVALSGVIIAMIVFLPETLTSVRAAWNGEIQRVSNLCHGAH